MRDHQDIAGSCGTPAGCLFYPRSRVQESFDRHFGGVAPQPASIDSGIDRCNVKSGNGP